MYSKNDIVNLYLKDYELTDLDKKLFEDYGLIIHYIGSDQIEYKDTLNIDIDPQNEKKFKVYQIFRSAGISSGEVVDNKYGDRIYREKWIDKELFDLLRLKYKEMIEIWDK